MKLSNIQIDFQKIIENDKIKRFAITIIPPRSGTLDLCFLRCLSGLSKILIILESFFNLINIRKLFINNIENIFITLIIFFYVNITIDQS